MAIYRCNTCGHLAEMPAEAIGTSPPCPRCAQPNPAYDNLFFVRRVLEKYFALRSAHKALQAELDNPQTPEAAAAPPPRPAADTGLDGIDLHNTSALSTAGQHRPIEDWFAARKIAAAFDHKAIDTSGFFDEAALEIGRNFEFLKPLIDQIRFAQGRGFTQLNLPLDKRSQKDAQAIVAFCRKLYEYSFLARCYHQKAERNLRLGLQPSAQIKDFFAGEWLEWFALMVVLDLCQERRIAFSCARHVVATFPNEDQHELDLFWLVQSARPVCIECKSGEFRPLIAKYSGLRKRLGLAKEEFVLCIAGLPDQQASGLTSMYDLTLVSEQGLRAHLASLVPGP